MVRSLENALLIAGSVVLAGAILCIAFGGLALLLLRPFEPSDPSLAWGTGLGVLFAGAFCGVPLGAVIGLTVAIGWIRRRGNEPWSVITWAGVAGGLAAGAAIAWAMHIELIGGVWHDRLEFWLTVALVLTVMATLGGFAASMLPIRKGDGDRKPRRHPRSSGRR